MLRSSCLAANPTAGMKTTSGEITNAFPLLLTRFLSGNPPFRTGQPQLSSDGPEGQPRRVAVVRLT